MEAENYLSSGYGLRLAIEERAVGWQRFGQIAHVTQPGRTKGILVAPEHGVPWLAATQIYDIRPVPRKWMAKDKLNDAAQLMVNSGTILVTRSGSVGRATIAQKSSEGVLISDDLLRVEPTDPSMWGWIYAYLRTPQARSMMTGAQYGHIIKHLETGHLDALPVPTVIAKHAKHFLQRTRSILSLRNRSHQLTLEAEAHLESALGPLTVTDWGEEGFSINAASLFRGRRRLEAARHNPGVRRVIHHLANAAKSSLALRDCGYNLWIPNRYKRIEASDGILYYDSADLMEANPDVTKRFADCGFGDVYGGRVKPNWLLMPCSGQVYGIIGSVVLAGAALADRAVSNHVLRIAPQKNAAVREGYLLTVLSHPQFGRPLIKALAFGSSVPEIDVEELRDLKIIRLDKAQEDTIADLAEESATLRAQADVLEREIASEASILLDNFIAGNMDDFAVSIPTV